MIIGVVRFNEFGTPSEGTLGRLAVPISSIVVCGTKQLAAVLADKDLTSRRSYHVTCADQ